MPTSPWSLQSSSFWRSLLVTNKNNTQRKHSLPVATVSPLAGQIFLDENIVPLSKTCWSSLPGLASHHRNPHFLTVWVSQSALNPSLVLHHATDLKLSLWYSAVQSGKLYCQKASPRALYQTKMLALLQSRSISCYCTAVSPLPVRQQQQRGFNKEIPHLQLPLSSSLPASASTVTAAGRKKITISFSLFSNRKTGYWSRLWLWRRKLWGNQIKYLSWNRDNKSTVASSGHLRN